MPRVAAKATNATRRTESLGGAVVRLAGQSLQRLGRYSPCSADARRASRSGTRALNVGGVLHGLQLLRLWARRINLRRGARVRATGSRTSGGARSCGGGPLPRPPCRVATVGHGRGWHRDRGEQSDGKALARRPAATHQLSPRLPVSGWRAPAFWPSSALLSVHRLPQAIGRSD